MTGAPPQVRVRAAGALGGEHAAEIARFLVVGLSAVATDFATYFALTGLLGAPASPAKATSFVAGALVAFALNRGFVFRSRRSARRQALPFAILYLASLALNTSVNSGLLSAASPRLLAWFVATGASTISNYLGMKLVVFREGGS